MLLIPRYILRAHVGPFLFGTAIVIFIFLLQFVIKYIDQLVGKGLDTWVIIQLIVLNIAWMLVLAVPIGVLFSVLMAFGAMSAAHEVTVIKASGGSLLQMMLPVMIAATFVAGGLFWFNDYVLPDTNHHVKILMSDIQRKLPTFSIEKGQFSTSEGLGSYTILSRDLDSATGAMLGVTIYDYTKPQRMNVLSADSGRIQFSSDFSKLIVSLTNGEIHQVNQRDFGNYRKINFAKHRIAIDASGFSFEKSQEGTFSRGDREMSIADMEKIANSAKQQADTTDSRIGASLTRHANYLFGDSLSPAYAPGAAPLEEAQALAQAQSRASIMRSTLESDVFQKESSEGEARQYQVEINKKYAIPFACIVFALVACPLGVITRGGSFGISAAYSLGFFIFYWMCLIGGEKLADRGLTTPWLGLWIGNIALGVLGIILTIRVNSERQGGRIATAIGNVFRTISSFFKKAQKV
ncbi:MAG TPA: LptF/LptG family permease [Patescibacteria group bacterium]|nr:LptF/LptG family permease [Patescibacteria group bacterium]